jgi:hypothetical protein
MSADWLNGIGLVCNIVGALGIFRFGVPHYPTRERAGTSALLLERDDPEERARVERAYRASQGAALLLVAGFVLQFVALLAY